MLLYMYTQLELVGGFRAGIYQYEIRKFRIDLKSLFAKRDMRQSTRNEIIMNTCCKKYYAILPNLILLKYAASHCNASMKICGYVAFCKQTFQILYALFTWREKRCRNRKLPIIILQLQNCHYIGTQLHFYRFTKRPVALGQ